MNGSNSLAILSRQTGHSHTHNSFGPHSVIEREAVHLLLDSDWRRAARWKARKNTRWTGDRPIGSAIESRGSQKPFNFYNWLWRVPVIDIYRPGASTTLCWVPLSVGTRAAACGLFVLLSHFMKTTRSTFSSNKSSSRNSDRRYLRNNELLFLVGFLLERTASLAEAIACSKKTHFRSLADLHSRAEESLSLRELNAMPLQCAELERCFRDTLTDVQLAHQLLRSTLQAKYQIWAPRF